VRLADRSGVVARLARDLAERGIELTISIKRLAQEITQLAEQLVPTLLAPAGLWNAYRRQDHLRDRRPRSVQVLRRLRPLQRHWTAASLVGEQGQTPTKPHRKPQLNADLYRIALTRARWHPSAQAMIERRRSNGDSGREAVRITPRERLTGAPLDMRAAPVAPGLLRGRLRGPDRGRRSVRPRLRARQRRRTGQRYGRRVDDGVTRRRSTGGRRRLGPAGARRERAEARSGGPLAVTRPARAVPRAM
jgi:hypothetical protein